MLIPVQELIKRYHIKINGVLHLGAHQAEEASEYVKAGAQKVIWIEGNPELMVVLETELKKYPNQFVYNVLVSDTDGKDVSFKVTNNFQSSSILEFGTHKEHFPSVKVHHVLNLKTQRLDTFFNKNNIDLNGCNFLNIDLQGAELLALKGLGDKLKLFDYVYTEVNVGSVYVGCATLHELDSFMHKHGFYRTVLSLTKWQWGDALYVKMEASGWQKSKNIIGARFYQTYYNFLTLGKNIGSGIKSVYYKGRRVLSKIKHYKSITSAQSMVDPTDNGEAFLIEKITKLSEKKLVVFDVGANVGIYTNLVLRQIEKQNISNYEIHLFEPQQKCFQTLKQLFENNKNVFVNHFALSDIIGESIIHTDFSGSSSASLFERKSIGLSEKELIQLKTLKSYIIQNNISHIDLLKIDTEGNEKKVLIGGGEFVKPDFISAIQFEYGGTYLDAHITLAEVVQMLLNSSYFVGKLTKENIEYKAELGDFIEDYAYSNYVASKNKL